ncbi:hypothetical protein LZD49_34565 [Dyadobacter sp. CY261]|uniref:hypothetical protein n=1 Tax=Dyadobacter sp. CY261 TaxID=2907203 RepID=UPI001F3F05C9|nr:hypothetical protein [Dyadobacter sp. CY261]MCF0075647.1 hypothetical protein [Dyadobacter sp. CY261]
MTTRTLALLFAFSFAISLSGCTDEESAGGVICTEEFRYALLHVPGVPLADSYTVRLSNSDTIRNLGNSDLRSDNYIVLDDNYQPKLENQQDTFRFIGKRGGEVVVREDYVFKADRCHITKLSGKDTL